MVEREGVRVLVIPLDLVGRCEWCSEDDVEMTLVVVGELKKIRVCEGCLDQLQSLFTALGINVKEVQKLVD